MTKRIISAVLAMILVMFCFTGCHKKGETVVTIDGYDVPSGLYLAIQFESFNTFYSDVTSNVGSTVSGGVSEYMKYSIDGVKSTDYIHNKTMETLRSFVAVERRFNDAGLTLTEEDNNLIDSYTTYYWTTYGYQDIYEINGVSKESFRLVMENSVKKSKLFKHYYMPADKETGVGGVYAVSDDEVKGYMNNHYILANTFSSDTSALTEEGAAATRVSLLNSYAARINSGESYDTAAAAYQTETGESITGNSSSNTGYATTQIDTSKSIYPASAKVFTDEDSDPTQYTTLKDIKSRDGFEFGKAYVQDDTESLNSATLAVLYDITQDSAYIDGYRESVVSSLKNDEFDNLLKTDGEAFEVKENQSLVNYYSPNNIKLTTR